MKDLERSEIGLQEKRKHSAGKLKKLKKSIQEVRNCSQVIVARKNLSIGQETVALRTAAQTLKDSESKIEKGRQNLEEHEASLEIEEKVMEDIQDGLKGRSLLYIHISRSESFCRQNTGFSRQNPRETKRNCALDN